MKQYLEVSSNGLESRVIATCFPKGVTGPQCPSAVRESTGNNIPLAEHIGEAVHEAVEHAWKKAMIPAVKILW